MLKPTHKNKKKHELKTMMKKCMQNKTEAKVCRLSFEMWMWVCDEATAVLTKATVAICVANKYTCTYVCAFTVHPHDGSPKAKLMVQR